MTEEKIQVMLVDDHSAFRQPLAFMMEQEPDITVVAEATSLADAREILESNELGLDVAVVDLDLPDGSGAEFIHDLRCSRPQAIALVLSAHSEPGRIAPAIEAEAAGVVHKTARFQDILDAVRTLRSGEQLISPQEVIEALRFLSREREESQHARLAISQLTVREREVLQALAEGLGDREISDRLYVGTGTIHSHMANILNKLGVNSRLQALIFAVRHGVVEIK